MKRAAYLLVFLACILTLPGKTAGARDLARFFEQESWLAYGAFAQVHTAAMKSGLIQAREDNYRFVGLDPSFALRNIIAVWELSEVVRGKSGGPLYPASSGPSDREPAISAGDACPRILELLYIEAQQSVRHIPDDANYRMTVLVVSEEGGPVLERGLVPLAGELPVSVQATNRFNARLPLSGVDVAANAVAPYVIAQGPGNRISYRELTANKEMALRIVTAMSEYCREFGKTSLATRRSLRQRITREGLTAYLQAMLARGEL